MKKIFQQSLRNSFFRFSTQKKIDIFEPLTEKTSSGTIIDHQEFKNTDFFGSLKQKAKNYIALNNTESIFLDFKRSQFAQEVALQKYLNLQRSIKKKDKTQLQLDLSFSLYYLIKNCIKNNEQIPFKLYNKDEIVSFQILQARQFQKDKISIKSQTWHQITVKLTVKEGLQEENKIICFERRESDLLGNLWRICHLE